MDFYYCPGKFQKVYRIGQEKIRRCNQILFGKWKIECYYQGQLLTLYRKLRIIELLLMERFCRNSTDCRQCVDFIKRRWLVILLLKNLHINDWEKQNLSLRPFWHRYVLCFRPRLHRMNGKAVSYFLLFFNDAARHIYNMKARRTKQDSA